MPCSVPNSQECYLRKPNLPSYMKCAKFECCYIIDSTILIYYIVYLWYSTLIVMWTFICMYLTLLFSMKSCPNYVKISFWTCCYMSMRSIRYFSVNTETEPKIPKRFSSIPNFGRNWSVPIFEEPNFCGNRCTELIGLVISNAQANPYLPDPMEPLESFQEFLP
jgi:hypothetical protein